MIYFDTAHPKIIDALNEHVRCLRDKIWEKVKIFDGGKYINLLTPCTIDAVLRMEPRKLFQLNLLFYKSTIAGFKLKDFEYYLSLGDKKKDPLKKKFNELKGDLDKLFDYKSFCTKGEAYSAYNLADKLDVPTCIYCNRIYTKTVIRNKKKKITRPAFDHWYPKSKFPLLQLSFYNLIPSCTICNSGSKGSSVFNLKEYFHPYVKRENFKYTFSYDHTDYSKFKFKIITNNIFSQNSIKAFELEEIYKAHEDEIVDLRAIKDGYSPAYLENLKAIFKGGKTVLLDSEIYRLAFGVHYEEDKFDRRPLSKMKKDILKELGIIS